MLRGSTKIQQHFSNRLVTGPTVEPVTLAEVKLHLREDGTDQDDYIIDSICAARAEIEAATGLCFLTQTWRYSLDHWPGHAEPWWDGPRVGSQNMLHGGGSLALIEPTKYPLQSVESMTVYDEDSNATSVTFANVFDLDTDSWPARFTVKRGATWPVALRQINAIEFTYKAGFGDEPSDVPEQYKRAVRTMAAWMYDNRGTGCSTGDAYSMSGARAMMSKFARARI